MNGPFTEGNSMFAGGTIRRPGARRRNIAAAVALLLFLATLLPAVPSSAGDPAATPRSFEQRAAAERTSRSRFRRLEVASLVLILACGGAVTWWVLRRK